MYTDRQQSGLEYTVEGQGHYLGETLTLRPTACDRVTNPVDSKVAIRVHVRGHA